MKYKKLTFEMLMRRCVIEFRKKRLGRYVNKAEDEIILAFMEAPALINKYYTNQARVKNLEKRRNKLLSMKK